MTKGSISFLKDFNKQLTTIEGVGTSSAPPRYWYTTGNYVLNKIISGSYFQGIAQGRVTNLAGPSGSGKSFVAANLIREAQKQDAIILVVDTENALDDIFMQKIGVNTKQNYYYAGVTTIAQAIEVISSFLKGYKAECGNDLNAPKVLIVLDSLDMLMTETELEHYDKGIQKGDQGQKNKQLKAMLRSYVQDIKPLNVSMLVTSQVYKNQDLLNGEGLWIISEAVRFSASTIILLTKMKLKETGTSTVLGIRMKCEGYKTRFTQPYQTVVIEVPYQSGMDPYSGLKDAAIELGILEKAGSRLRMTNSDDTWYEKDIGKYADNILLAAEKQTQAYLRARIDNLEEVEDETTETKQETTARRKAKVIKQS